MYPPQKKIGTFFCKTCLSFQLCTTCVCKQHKDHDIISSLERKQTIQLAKDHIFETVEDTLKKLKFRENQMKNMVCEIKLIYTGFYKLKEDLLITTKNIFNDIQKMIDEGYISYECKYTDQLQKFNIQYNKITQELRNTLLSIVNGDFSIQKFNRSMVVIQPPQLPNFNKIKSQIQSQKKIYKDVKKQVQNFQKNVFEIFKPKKNQPYLKYEKFMTQKNNNQQPKEYFLKTLRIIDKENFPFLNLPKKL